MNYNPYQPPATHVSASYSSGDGQISPLALQHLIRTQPWVRLISIVGLIGVACMLIMLMVSFLGISRLERRGFNGPEEAGYIAGSFGMMLIISLLYIYPLIKLSKYAAAIRKLRISLSIGDFEDALNQQRGFWKFVGVLTLISVIFFGFAFLMGVLAPMSRRF